MRKTIGLSLLFAGAGCLLLILVFNIVNAYTQANNLSTQELAEIKNMCVLGSRVDSFPFYVYKDADSGKDNNFFPTGNMGDLNNSEIDYYCKDAPYAGKTCIKIKTGYRKNSSQVYGWVGLYWQYPANNWGDIPKAYDLTGAKRLTFWARGQYGREIIVQFQVGGISGKYRDSAAVPIGPIKLSKKWKQYTIDLTNLNEPIIVSKEDKDCWPFMGPLTRIIGGFSWATNRMANRDKGITFYLDEIRFENE